MDVYTYQIAQWRKVDKLGIERLDITVKSGEALLAPTWTLLSGYKKGYVDEDQYTKTYLSLLEERYLSHPDYFEALSLKPIIALGCYCRAGVFCHRLLLVKFLESKINLNYIGEIK